MIDEIKAREDIAAVARLLYERNYAAGTEGNLSIRLDGKRVLSTPSGTCKGRLTPQDMIVTNLEGAPLVADKGNATTVKRSENPSGKSNKSTVEAATKRIEAAHSPLSAGNVQTISKPSTELLMHLEVYKRRSDVQAIVHAHPPVAIGFSVAGVALDSCILPEVICTLGIIPTAPYATPSTQDLADSVGSLIDEHDALLLDHHGALTAGGDIWDAFYKMETVERFAQIMLVAHQLGGARPLTKEQVKKLLAIRSVYGLTRPLPVEKILK